MEGKWRGTLHQVCLLRTECKPINSVKEMILIALGKILIAYSLNRRMVKFLGVNSFQPSYKSIRPDRLSSLS